jgi:thiol-disulfide isomerase/thioredoxin
LPYLTAAVVLAGILGTASLLFVLVLARRIRALGTGPVIDMPPGGSLPAYRLPPGSKPRYFEAITTAGDTVSPASLAAGRALVGFFAPGCGPCHDQLPGFVELAKTIPGGPSQVLAVVSGVPEVATEFASGLADVASIVLEHGIRGAMGPVAHAFASYAKPSFYLLAPDGSVESSSAAIPALTANLTAAKNSTR